MSFTKYINFFSKTYGSVLSDEGRKNLDKYLEYNESLRNSGKQIQIPSGSDELKKQLEGWGYKVSTASDRSFT
ncbi:hypothetical protein [Mycoplasma leachii]|uniref:hypothetical protein n=1 Tax=Mycoplasma leachii TaxID=2105 RepID=UPI003DA47503